jgi:excisionase family DNA binding protein
MTQEERTVTVIPFTSTTRVPATRANVPDRAVYTVAEVARLLAVSLGSAYALVRDGTIPAKKIGGRWVIPKVRFHTWLNDQADEPEPAVPAARDPYATASGRRR